MCLCPLFIHQKLRRGFTEMLPETVAEIGVGIKPYRQAHIFDR